MGFTKENNKSRMTLLNLLNQTDAGRWDISIKGGWTVGTLFCHIAFWDKMTTHRLAQWSQSGKLAVLPDQENIEAINASVRSMCSAIPCEAGKELVSNSMMEIDDLVSRLNSSQIKELEESGRARWFQRNLHRELHVSALEKQIL